jgi:hypothetical protein
MRFLGMVNYLSKFIPNLSAKAAELRELNRNDTIFTWNEHYQKLFDRIKQDIVTAPTLKFYDPKKPITLTCDASKAGIGAAVIQGGAPVAYASKAMTEVQTRYAQIENELLAVTFACRKFDDYAYGRDVTVETDHKPLETIFKKSILSIPKRLQDMMLKLQRYNLNVVYKRGSELYIADTLSRAYRAHPEDDELLETEYEVMSVNVAEQRFSTTAVQNLKEETENDEQMKMLMNRVHNGWPTAYRSVPDMIKPFYAFRDELVIVDDVVTKGDKVVVPTKLRENYMQQAHQGHLSTDAMKRRMKDVMFWPMMNSDIENYVKKCAVCNSMKQHQQKEPMITHEVPIRPWSIVACDIFTWNRLKYLVTVDSYSGWFEIDGLKSETSKSVINHLKGHFARFGIPDIVFSDNGPQFQSEFKKFASDWKFIHETSSPEFPQSNGLAENAVKRA